MTRRLRLAGLISGGGRTLLNLVDRIEQGRLDAKIAVAIASRSDAPGVTRLRERGLEVEVVDPRSHPDPDSRITTLVAAADVDLVCLCGYLRRLRLDPTLVGKTINIHPALLPDFGGQGMYGLHVHRAVIAAGRMFSGCTVHEVDGEYDHGPTILQRVVPVFEGDTAESLAARVFVEECEAYPEAIERWA